MGHEPGRLEAQGHTAVQCRPKKFWQQQKNSRRAVSNQIAYAPVQLEAVTTVSKEVRVSDTSHFTRPTEIQKSLELAKPAADRAVPGIKSEISQQQNGGRAVSAHIGHAPVRLGAQGQNAVQCRQSEKLWQQNGGRAVPTQIGHAPSRLEAQGQTAVQCRQNNILQQQKSSGAVSTQSVYVPVRLEAQGQTADQHRLSEQQNSSRAGSNQMGHVPVRLEAATTESREVRMSDTSHLTRPRKY